MVEEQLKNATLTACTVGAVTIDSGNEKQCSFSATIETEQGTKEIKGWYSLSTVNISDYPYAVREIRDAILAKIKATHPNEF